MKAGGIFGGGEGVAPWIPPYPLAPTEVKGGVESGGLTLNDIHNTSMGFGIADRAVGIANNIFSYLLSTQQMEMYEHIADAKIAAEREMAGFQRDLTVKFMQYSDDADKRMNGPDGLHERVARLHENTAIEKHRITTEAEKEMNAERTLDRAFGMRSEPFYGLPT